VTPEIVHKQVVGVVHKEMQCIQHVTIVNDSRYFDRSFDKMFDFLLRFLSVLN